MFSDSLDVDKGVIGYRAVLYAFFDQTDITATDIVLRFEDQPSSSYVSADWGWLMYSYNKHLSIIILFLKLK